ncbi:biopolymer transporter ExbD [Natronospirillum operosum]|uniref:Biopolymer transporter ExbD n=1 Tax=Natronospirillum operosum TaxID=2759953 RepID=A0A4Z0WJ70_9GAMM|nr:biopolymer transporter ExbD [Natronospirillum operosum]TGG95581.1 biopolymer transporter ExbD [Natronospirillum operosum]
MSLNFRRAQEDDVSINLTPLIDVVFLLLIFFMVTTTFTRETQLEVELPQVQSEQAVTDNFRVDVVIDASGNIEINGEMLINSQADTLRRALDTVLDAGSQQVVVITTDRQTPSQALLTVMDVVGRMGHSRIAFAAQIDAD